MRQSVERVFKSAKESRRLERHCIRRFPKVALHSAMSFLSFQMTSVFNLRCGRVDLLSWMVVPVP